MNTLKAQQLRRAIMPTRAIGLLMFIGFADLFATAIMHEMGMITELNPLMKPLIEQSELLFSGVKALTLVLAWWMMAKHAQKNLAFVRRAALAGSVTYLVVWVTWFLVGHFAG